MLVDTTEVWYFVALCSLGAVASSLHPHIHEAVSQTISSKDAEAHARVHKGEPPPLESPGRILHRLPDVGFRLHPINPVENDKA